MRAPGQDRSMEGQPEHEPQPGPTAADKARAVAGATARGTAKATVASAKGAKAVGTATGRGAKRAFLLARRATHAEGAGDSGLSRLIELHAFNAAGDAAVAISLAGTLFFQVPTGEARGQVALFLGLTMLPFAIVAPLIGPFLDRFSHGRRWAIGATMAIRAFLCWVLAGAVAPSRRGCSRPRSASWSRPRRTASRKAAAVPRLLPPAAQPGQGELADLAGRRHRRGRLGAARGAGVDLRAGVVAALRVPGVRRRPRSWRSCCPRGWTAPRARSKLSLPPRGSSPRRPPVPRPGGFALRANCRAAAAVAGS